MNLISKVEFRGKDEKVTEKGHYYFVNLEDEEGESCKFQISNNNIIDLTQFKKGDKVKVTFDFSIKYGSLRVLDISKGV